MYTCRSCPDIGQWWAVLALKLSIFILRPRFYTSVFFLFFFRERAACRSAGCRPATVGRTLHLGRGYTSPSQTGCADARLMEINVIFRYLQNTESYYHDYVLLKRVIYIWTTFAFHIGFSQFVRIEYDYRTLQ